MSNFESEVVDAWKAAPIPEAYPAVTLEGLAAVISALNDGLRREYTHEASEKALTAAASAVTAILTTQVVIGKANEEQTTPTPEAQEAAFTAATKERFDAETRVYNRAITDAHNAVADALGCASDGPAGPKVQAEIRKLYREAK